MRLDSIEAAGYTIDVEGNPGEFSLELSVSTVAEAISEVHLRLYASHPIKPGPLVLSWYHPMIATHLKWHPGAHLNRVIEPNWNPQSFVSRGTTHAPVYALYSLSGTNALTFALSDALNPIRLSVGLVEESALAHCQVTLFNEPQVALQDYHLVLRLDRRPLPYEQILAEIGAWWASMPDYHPTLPPSSAYAPLYSTWYSLHQDLTAEAVEAQCRLAKALGMDVVIVDDGWQTDNNHRGYAYCGDWEVTPRKFPDFRAHVARIHEIGLKYLLWFSVPFLGGHTKAFRRFHDKVLDPDSSRGWHVLDPRFPEVRDYLIGIYRRFVLDYDLDGFKLDFVDAFCQTQPAPSPSSGHDYASVSEAVDRLLIDITSELRQLKPDILIEFRQTYIGPLMRKYGNMLRAGDAPNTLIDNQVRILDVRLLAGATPVHADMLMWHPDESVENAAMQVIHALFGVPQISVRLDALAPSHVDMLRFYLALWRKHQDVLIQGTLHPQQPGYLYPLVIAENADKCLVACYGTTAVRLSKLHETLILVNGTFEEKLILDLGCDFGHRLLTTQTCCGAVLTSEPTELATGIHGLTVPPGGVVTVSTLGAS